MRDFAKQNRGNPLDSAIHTKIAESKSKSPQNCRIYTKSQNLPLKIYHFAISLPLRADIF
ncbi:hypothetical protein [Helicobacter sp. 23-1045]